MNLKGTKTEKNLNEAFAGESMARNKYTYYASKAKKDGYVQISNFFEQTANNEKEHAKLWFKLLHDGMPDTITNLKDAAAGENFEWTQMYARMAKEAREEGFDDIADTMEGVLAIEKTHEQRYVALLNNIEDGSVFEKSEETLWECLNCGHLHKGSVAPEVCPVCDHPKAYFEVHLENY
ncbi:MAG: rubrerythrin family protein [Longicatena sp.]